MPAATFLQLQHRLRVFWEEQGCVHLGPCDLPLRIGTLSPATFLQLTSCEPRRTVQILVNRCPRDSRPSPPPMRLSYRHQLQVFSRPAGADPLDTLRRSLRAAGFELQRRDLQIVDARFHVPELALHGAGWRVRLEGLPVAHVHLPQRLHGEAVPDAVEIAYELERLIMLQHGDSRIDRLPWADDVGYDEVAGSTRRELDEYWADRSRRADPFLGELDRRFEEAEEILRLGLRVPAYHQFLRCCEVLEILRARQGLGSLRERTWIERLSDLSRRCLPSGASP